MTAEGERRRLSMYCQRCYATKYEVFKQVGTLQSAQLVAFAFSSQLSRLRCAHMLKDFNLAE